MPRVSSSAILALDYVPGFELLRVTFVSGRIYTYAGVPQAVYDAFAAAPSKGQFFNAEILDRYLFEEQTAPPPRR